jgi:murein DD-endopeptidase MepM/ murein hydrolase activator NlpD
MWMKFLLATLSLTVGSAITASAIIAGMIGLPIALAQSTPANQSSQSSTDIQSEINAHNSTIAELQQEIAQYQTELGQATTQAATLKSAISNLATNSKKLNAELTLTDQQIDSATLKIQQLEGEISDKEQSIGADKTAIADSLREVNESDGESLLSVLLSYNDFSDFWNDVTMAEEFQSNVKDDVDMLQGLQKDLETTVTASQTQKQQLVSLQSQLANQKTAVDANKAAQSALLTETQSKESNYQKLIAQKESNEQSEQQALIAAESKLNLTVNPGSLPGVAPGVLNWPVVDPHKITQFFGNTDFAESHPTLYSGQGHDGLDIGVPIGTPVMAALDGVVKGTGNTDLTCPNASFGKWVFIEHANGLSTIYAHLSVIEATAGENVTAGEIVGLSGMTGYATGPHVHFGVYATSGSEITSFASAACKGATYTMPVGSLAAYLNPLNYLSNDYENFTGS